MIKKASSKYYKKQLSGAYLLGKGLGSQLQIQTLILINQFCLMVHWRINWSHTPNATHLFAVPFLLVGANTNKPTNQHLYVLSYCHTVIPSTPSMVSTLLYMDTW